MPVPPSPSEVETVSPIAPRNPKCKIKKIKLEPWGEDGIFTLKIKVKKPWLSGSNKCYIMAFEQGESDLIVEAGGKKRNVRMMFMLYSKVDRSERELTAKEEALQSERRGEPQLY